MEKKFKILNRNDNCVLLKRAGEIQYKVIDIENDVIFIGSSIKRAEEVFETYDINKVREERKRVFEDWLKENAHS